MYSFYRLTSFYFKMNLSNTAEHLPPFHPSQFTNHSISLTTTKEVEVLSSNCLVPDQQVL